MLRHATDDASLVGIVQNGIPGTEMPGLGLTENAAWQTAAYVRSLGRARAAPAFTNRRRARHATS